MKLTSSLLFIAGIFFLLIENTRQAADETECEVCIKVLGDIQTFADSKAEDKIDKAIHNHCELNKNLDRKDKRLCYHLLPMKGDVNRQLSIGKDLKSICKSLTKKNEEFCSMSYPVKTDKDTDYTKFRVKKLKQILQERGSDCAGCIEKDDYVKKCKETEHMEL